MIGGNMKYYKKFIGDRLYLSPMNPNDVEKYVEWISSPIVSDGMGNTSNILTESLDKEFIEKALKNGDKCFAIILLKNDELIGNCSIYRENDNARVAELGIFIGDEKFRNNGYGQEALNLLLDYGFNYLNLNSVYLSVFSFNDVAINCYKKIGFKEAGRLRENYFLNGKYYDVVYMDILKREFNGSYIRNKNIGI
jgi:acetyltransferase, GNAT family